MPKIYMFIHIINQNKENHISMIKFTRINIAFKNVFNWLCKVYGKYYGWSHVRSSNKFYFPWNRDNLFCTFKWMSSQISCDKIAQIYDDVYRIYVLFLTKKQQIIYIWSWCVCYLLTKNFITQIISYY